MIPGNEADGHEHRQQHERDGDDRRRDLPHRHLDGVGDGKARVSSILCSTFSTTTIASSTTMPMARTMANREMVLALNPSASRTANVPISETGTAIMRDERGADAAEEEENHEHDEDERLEQRVDRPP